MFKRITHDYNSLWWIDGKMKEVPQAKLKANSHCPPSPLNGGHPPSLIPLKTSQSRPAHPQVTRIEEHARNPRFFKPRRATTQWQIVTSRKAPRLNAVGALAPRPLKQKQADFALTA
jgi:hypothetical protein